MSASAVIAIGSCLSCGKWQRLIFLVIVSFKFISTIYIIRSTDTKRQQTPLPTTKTMETVNPSDLESKRHRRRLQVAKRLANMKENDPFKYREYLDSCRFSKLKRRATMTEEERKAENIKTYLSRQAYLATLTAEEIEEMRKKKIACTVRSEKNRWATATEEEKAERKLYCCIQTRKTKMRKKLRKQGISEQVIKQKVEEQEEIWWREVYPDGKPSARRKRGTKSVPIWRPKVLRYVCLKCDPLLIPGTNSYKINQFEKRMELLNHVYEEHSNFFFLCMNCGLLKYSQHDLDFHLKYCLT